MQTATGFESYGSKPIIPMTVEAAEAFAAEVAGVCEVCGETRRYTAACLGYERICSGCTNAITMTYTYVEFMAATNGTGNARLLADA
jgi:hypothetical protein